MKVGLIMMALALALVIAAVVVRITLGSEAGQEAAEVAMKSVGQASRYSSGEQGSATKKSSSEKKSSHYPSGKQDRSLGYGSSSSSGGPVEQRKEEDVKQPQAVVQQEAQTQKSLPASEQRDWPQPTQGELERANGPRQYELLPGAIMGLTIDAIGIYDAPVFDSDGRWALAKGVAHNPQTSLPWSPT